MKKIFALVLFTTVFLTAYGIWENTYEVTFLDGRVVSPIDAKRVGGNVVMKHYNHENNSYHLCFLMNDELLKKDLQTITECGCEDMITDQSKEGWFTCAHIELKDVVSYKTLK